MLILGQPLCHRRHVHNWSTLLAHYMVLSTYMNSRHTASPQITEALCDIIPARTIPFVICKRTCLVSYLNQVSFLNFSYYFESLWF